MNLTLAVIFKRGVSTRDFIGARPLYTPRMARDCGMPIHSLFLKEGF